MTHLFYVTASVVPLIQYKAVSKQPVTCSCVVVYHAAQFQLTPSFLSRRIHTRCNRCNHFCDRRRNYCSDSCIDGASVKRFLAVHLLVKETVQLWFSLNALLLVSARSLHFSSALTMTQVIWHCAPSLPTLLFCGGDRR